MATNGNIEYWQGWASGTTDTAANHVDAGATAISDGVVLTEERTTATTLYYHVPKPRKVLVRHPKSWGDADHDAYLRLVNIETKTGWIIEMLIRG